MGVIATFDVGTTAVKAVLVDAGGRALFSASRDFPTLYDGDRLEQAPEAWWAAFQALSRDMLALGYDVDALCMSGQMQDVIPVDEALRPVRPAMLYSDGRGAPQARRLIDAVGAGRLGEITGNPFDGTISLPKIVWMRENEPELYAKTRHFLISSKDYIIARLTGECVGDRTACSTAGAMDIRTGEWSAEILSAAGVEPERMPGLRAAHERVGGVLAGAAALTGFAPGTPVFAGAGDAGASSLASGLARPGQYNINLGTSGWVATVSERVLHTGSGVFNLAAMPVGKLVNIVPFLNGASVHRWVSVLNSDTGEPDYRRADALLRQAPPGSNGVMALPYLLGERFPIPDAAVRGSYVGITAETTRADMARAMLEGVAFSIRQGLEQMPDAAEQVSIIGGGARVAPWCQIMADVLGRPVSVFRDAEHLPARAIAAAAMIGLGRLDGYDSFVETLLEGGSDVYTPNAETHALYDALYARHSGLYGALKAWYTPE